MTDNAASLSDEQLAKIDNALKEKDEAIATKDATIADLQAKLAAKPAASTSTVVEDSNPGGETRASGDYGYFIC